jgi:YtkA-like
VRLRRRRNTGRLAGVLLAASLFNAACHRSTQSDSRFDVAWTLRPQAPVVGPAALTITLRTPSGDPVRRATVRLEGHMSHAGMASVTADATESAPGVYDLRFAFTMQGDWVLLVSAVLPNGARVERRIDVANVRPPG